MSVSFYVGLPWLFLAIFLIGSYLGAKAYHYKLKLDKAAEDYEKNFNCMGIRKPNPNRLAPPKPLHNPNI